MILAALCALLQEPPVLALKAAKVFTAGEAGVIDRGIVVLRGGKIAAVGRAEMVRGDWVKPGAYVIDVGINRIEDATHPKGSRLVGDVCFEEVKEVAGANGTTSARHKIRESKTLTLIFKRIFQMKNGVMNAIAPNATRQPC